MRSAILLRMSARVGGGRLAPGVLRRVGRVERLLDVLGGRSAGISQNGLPVTGVMFSKYWPLHGRDELAADVVAVALLERRRLRELDGFELGHDGLPARRDS